MANRRIRFLAACAALLAMSSAVAEDFEGQRFMLIDPYPESEVVEFEHDPEITSRQIILGALKRVNNVIQPGSSEFVRGSRTAITWRVPNERRTKVVQEFLRGQIAESGEILFECNGRGCGSSNYWANTVFHRAILYGLEESQYYLLSRMTGESTYYVALYVAQRGTGALYSHLDIIGTEDTDHVVDGITVRSALASRGKYILPWVVDEHIVSAIVEALQTASHYRVAVVGHDHLNQNESPQEAMTRTGERAADLRGRIIAGGIGESRVQSFGVGPLAPLDVQTGARLEIVLLGD